MTISPHFYRGTHEWLQYKFGVPKECKLKGSRPKQADNNLTKTPVLRFLLYFPQTPKSQSNRKVHNPKFEIQIQKG